MQEKERLDAIRNDSLNAMAQTERLFHYLLGLCCFAEVAGVALVLWCMEWDNSTHRLIFFATMLIWVNLALWVAALAVRNRVGEQRILRAIEASIDDDDLENNNVKNNNKEAEQ